VTGEFFLSTSALICVHQRRRFFHCWPFRRWVTIRNTFPNFMSSKSPAPRFEHRPVRGMSPRMESYCLLCKRLVAASDKPSALRIAEKAHICPSRTPKR
jgi:hypothetical protein